MIRVGRHTKAAYFLPAPARYNGTLISNFVVGNPIFQPMGKIQSAVLDFLPIPPRLLHRLE
jgi:hypothetical protein